MESMKMIETNHNQSKCRVVNPSFNGYICKTLPYLMIREHFKRVGEKTGKARRSGNLL